MPNILGYVNRLETQAVEGLAPRHVAFLTEDEAGEEKELQVETYVHQIQTTIELAYATRRLVDVTYKEDGGSRFVTVVNIQRREKPLNDKSRS